MTTTQTDQRILDLLSEYGMDGSSFAKDLLAALQARNQQGPIKTWQQRLEETCPALGPMHIHASVEEVNDAMQAEIDALRAAMQAPKRLWGMAGFNPPLPNVGEKYTSIHEDDLGDHVTVTGVANTSSPNIAYVFLSWDDGHYGERAIDEFWQEYMLVQTNEQAREGEADCRIELVNAVHTLASHYENNLYKLKGDEEAMRMAKGDIAHAMRIATKWNWNGTAPQPAQPSEPWCKKMNGCASKCEDCPDAPSEPAQPEQGEPDAQLCKFYQVETFPELVAAMEKHIEKLQSKLPKSRDTQPGRVREG